MGLWDLASTGTDGTLTLRAALNSRGCCREMNVLQTSERRKGTDIREKKYWRTPHPEWSGQQCFIFSISKHRGIRGSTIELTRLFSGALITQSPSRSFLKPHLAETTASPPCPCPSSQTHGEGNSPQVAGKGTARRTGQLL